MMDRRENDDDHRQRPAAGLFASVPRVHRFTLPRPPAGLVSEQLLALTRTHGQWEREPEKIRLTPGSVSITSGVWPDPVTSIEPVYWGVGNDLFAFLVMAISDRLGVLPLHVRERDLVDDVVRLSVVGAANPAVPVRHQR